MRAADPVVTFLLVLVIGVVAGILFDRLAGPSWLARQFSGSTRGIVTSALVGVAGAFVGYHIEEFRSIQSHFFGSFDENITHLFFQLAWHPDDSDDAALGSNEFL